MMVIPVTVVILVALVVLVILDEVFLLLIGAAAKEGRYCIGIDDFEGL